MQCEGLAGILAVPAMHLYLGADRLRQVHITACCLISDVSIFFKKSLFSDIIMKVNHKLPVKRGLYIEQHINTPAIEISV